MKKNIYIILILIFYFQSAFAGKKIETIYEGNKNAKIKIIVFESLTCGACGNFHKNVYPDLKKDFIDTGLVKFEHHPFPLDLAALNAEIILRCGNKDEKKFELLGIIYKKQNFWAVGTDINRINELIMKIGSEFNMKDERMSNCLKNDRSHLQSYLNL